MTENIEIPLVSRITIDFVGEPGNRMFLLQATDGVRMVTLKLEKEQVRALANRGIQLIEDIAGEYPDLPDAEFDRPSDYDLQLSPPYEPLFAVGQLGLGFDHQRDQIVLAAQELQLQETDDTASAQLWMKRGQLLGMSEYALDILAHGRPICPLCERPIDPEGHFCPPQNGHHKHPEV